METNKEINTVNMVREIRNAHNEEIKKMSLAERLNFYKEKSNALRDTLAKLVKEPNHINKPR